MTTGRINQVTILQGAIKADRPKGRPGFITKRRRGRRPVMAPEAQGYDSWPEPASGSPNWQPESRDYLFFPLPRANFGGNCDEQKTECSNTLHRSPNLFIDFWPEAINPSGYLQHEVSHNTSNPPIGTVQHGSKADTLIPSIEWTLTL